MAELLTIRPATVDDVPAIANVHVAAWEAYRGLLSDEVIDSRTVTVCEQQWREILGKAGERTTVAERAGRIAGFCTVATPSRDEDAPAGTAEIAAIYVSPSDARAGVGSALLEAAVAGLRRDGWQAVTLWVLETNAGARAFYEAHGFFTAEGAQRLSDRPVVRMRRPLTSAG